MRNQIMCVAILATAVLASSALAVDPNLVAWYKFDEGSGTTAYDSARTHDATVYGATWVAGKVGGALSFNGWDNFVSAPDHPELNITGDITIAAWVNFSEGGLMYDGSEKAIVSKCVFNGAFANPYDFRTSISIEPDLTFVRANDSAHECAYSTFHISLNTWHHVAVTEENGTASFYVDGVLTAMYWGEPPLTSHPTGNDLSLLIGARDDGLFFNGMIDDVRIYDRALTVGEIRTIPEPATLLLLGLGAAIVRKRRSL